ncbi:MAG: DUF2189 domain-containing protein, partial [Pseudomonadota bacterium]
MTAEQSQKPQTLTIKAAGLEDLSYALKAGWRDFLKAPQYGLFFGIIYAAGGLLMIWLTAYLGILWAAYPLMIGFALIGPFIATGLYEVSRRLEAQQSLNWSTVLFVMVDQHRRELGWMAFVTLFVFWVWMYQARTIFVIFFGSKGFASMDSFVTAVFTTEAGWWFLLVGHAVGAAISIVLYALTVISCPLLLDRDVDFVTAMLTSIRTVIASPVVMIGWGLFVIVSVMLSMLP